MEISLLSKNALKIKGKKTVFAVNIAEKLTQYNAVLFLKPDDSVELLQENTVMIMGAGDYEVSGVKISGIRGGDEIVYSLSVDSIDILIGSTEALEKVQHKVKEHTVVVVSVITDAEPSFVTGLATNGVVFFGEKAEGIVKQFAKEGVRTESKYQVLADKLPTEIETILLSDK